MATNIEVVRSGSENPAGLIRRFSKRVQDSRLIPHVRGNRYFARPPSKTNKRKNALKRISKRETYEEMLKLGKIIEQKKTRRR